MPEGMGTSSTMVEFSDKKKSNPIQILAWVSCVISIVFVVAFYVMYSSTNRNVIERQSERDEIIGQLNSQTYLNIEKEAKNFKEAFSTLSTLSTAQVTKSEILSQLYASYTKDVKIIALTLDSDGHMTLNGKTATYRTAADFMTALKSNKKIKKVNLTSVTLDTEGKENDNEKVAFVVTAVVDLAKEVTGAASTSESTPTGTETTPTPNNSGI